MGKNAQQRAERDRSRMAKIMEELAASQDSATEGDLIAAGFSPAQIRRHGPSAAAMAARNTIRHGGHA